jgi:hypothetical protein
MRPVRRAQAISPFGVGAMVDFPGPTSLIHAGLDAWPVQNANNGHEEYIVEDERLARRLKVDFFVLPPDYREKPILSDESAGNYRLQLPFLRFPLWHFCPSCGRMHKAKYQQRMAPSCIGPYSYGGLKGKDHKTEKTVQVRFVAACEKGHLQDFPWLEWLQLDDKSWQPDGVNRWLRLDSSGSAGADGIKIFAEERVGGEIKIVGRPKSLAGALGGDFDAGNSPLSQYGIKCTGHNPVLGIGEYDAPGCGEKLFVQLRGAASLYFADVKSSIYIPNFDNQLISLEIRELLEDDSLLRTLLRSAKESDDGILGEKSAAIALSDRYPEKNISPKDLSRAINENYLKDLIIKDRLAEATLIQLAKIDGNKVTEEILGQILTSSKNLKLWSIKPKQILEQVARWYEKNHSNELSRASSSSDEEESYRAQEYKVFCSDIQDTVPKTNLLIKSNSIDEYSKFMQHSFERISQLHKLRETRAFAGFSRIFAKTSIPPHERKGLISSESLNWLPAIIVRGEGIFFKFNLKSLEKWEIEYEDFHRKRLDPINLNLSRMAEKRHLEAHFVSPRYALIHTFGHLVINQLVFDCGYSSAALRERVYCSGSSGDDMAGILIYTAAGDSEGTMGGLVKMGSPNELDKVVSRAIEKAKWCSVDPVCIESKGQGPDSCNLAACHSCALIPETSCEEQNRLLDRAVLIGTLEKPESGFFSNMF